MRGISKWVLAVGVIAALASPQAALAKKKTASATNASYMVPLSQQKPPAEKFNRRVVNLETNEKPGTLIVDTNNKFLYLIEDGNSAVRYGIGVGREGFGWSGVVKIFRKAEWPDWVPPKEMIYREAKKGHIIPPFMKGGEDNPLGARAMYLSNKKGDSGFRIHGTNQPWSIGQNMSSGCIRMMNKDVIDLYSRADIGAKVIVVGPGNKQGDVKFAETGINFLRTLFGG